MAGREAGRPGSQAARLPRGRGASHRLLGAHPAEDEQVAAVALAGGRRIARTPVSRGKNARSSWL